MSKPIDIEGLIAQKFYVLFDGPPSHESGRFVEVENESRASISLNAGSWHKRDDNYWTLGPFVTWSDYELLRNALAQLRDQRDEAIKERDEFQRKYHEAMLILTRWENLDSAEAVGRMIEAEKRADAAEEVSAQLREALEYYRDGIEWTNTGAGAVQMAPDDGSRAEGALAATPTGRTATLEALLRDATELFKPTGFTFVRLAEQEWYDKARAALDRK
jgi:hypothetical protein